MLWLASVASIRTTARQAPKISDFSDYLRVGISLSCFHLSSVMEILFITEEAHKDVFHLPNLH